MASEKRAAPSAQRVGLWVTLTVALAACGGSSTPAAGNHGATVPEAHVVGPQEPEAAFGALSARFLDEYFQRAPTLATQAGEHRYDDRWPDVSVEGEAKDRDFVQKSLGELRRIPREALGPQSRVDYALLENQLESWLFSIEELEETEQNPLFYTGLIGDGIDPLVTRDFAPIGERMKSLHARLEWIPILVEVAKKRLKSPPRVHTETAIQQNRGLIDLCSSDLKESFDKVPGQRAALESASRRAAAALTSFQTFLEKDLLARSTGDFRLGRARFERKLRFALEDHVSAEAMAKGARELLTKTQAEMFETAKELWPSLRGPAPFPKATTVAEKNAVVRTMLDAVATDHSSDATVVPDASKLLGDATRFVREHDLVGLPTEACQIIEMPEYRRGVSVAYCDASGPLEQKQETFYAISPTPKSWTPERVASYYREYNRSMLAELTVHEAMPGHFLQLMVNNKFPSKLRAVFSNGAFVEGWAVYAEWLMAKYGFGGPKVRITRQKMMLRAAANAILDFGVHAGDLDEKGALALMMNDAFQEEGEAAGKWRRARLSSAQLTTYYYGFSEMMRLREHAEKASGFSERAYHDKLLSFGSPSLRAIRELMGAGKD